MRRYCQTLKLYTRRFYPAGNYEWVVPTGCTSVEVFLVGGGGAGLAGGGGGYTKTFKGDGYTPPPSGTWSGTYEEGRDGNAIAVTPGQVIPIVVGAGGIFSEVVNDSEKNVGGYSEFMNNNYRAEGGKAGYINGTGGLGGSGGGSYRQLNTAQFTETYGGSDGHNSAAPSNPGIGQGHTTRDFGEPEGKRNAGGGAGGYGGTKPTGMTSTKGGESDYEEGSGLFLKSSYGYYAEGGGGYGGGGGHLVAPQDIGLKSGGDGTVLIRYWAY